MKTPAGFEGYMDSLYSELGSMTYEIREQHKLINETIISLQKMQQLLISQERHMGFMQRLWLRYQMPEEKEPKQ